MQENWAQSLGWEDAMEKKRATPFSSLAWEIPWTEETDRLDLVINQQEQQSIE